MPAFDFVLAGRYRLLAPLGEGGMAAVYRGRDLRLNREVAVKILHENLTHDADFLARFRREAQVVASLSHPHIVPVYDVGEENGSHFIVMEYVRGRTLKEQIESSGSLTPDRCSAIMSSVLHALAYAHGRGLIHRDVKPQNILIDPDGAARLADFGIVHQVDGSTSRTAAILGSAHYLSPEQLRGEAATPRSDIYACGAVLYEMLTGKPPFDGPNALVIANQHLNVAPAPLPSSVPPHLAAPTMRALDKDPARRFQDATEFATALQASPQDPGATEVYSPSAPSQPAQRPAAENVRASVPGDLILRRSARKTGVLAALCGVAVVLAAMGANGRYWGHSLPAYPSAPYALVPAFLALILLLSWFSVRSWSYTMNGNAAVIQWGLLGHHRFGVPLRYITTLELKQSLIDRVLGVGTVELCARDRNGREHRLVMEDLPRPQATYEELMRMLGQVARSRLPDHL